MVYRKAVYQVVNGDMEEKTAESFDEFCAYCKDGWHDHPETARNAVVEVDEIETSLLDMTKKELVDYANDTFGVELDRRKTKPNMLAELQELIG